MVLVCLPAAAANKKAGAVGTVVLGGGQIDSETTDLLIQRMVELAGEKPNVVIIPTADARLEPAAKIGASITPIDYENDARPDFVSLGAGRVKVVHTRNRFVVDTPNFVDALHYANLVWIPGGDPQLLFNVYTRSKFDREIRTALDRGAVIAGDSAGAMLLGQIRFIVDLDQHPKGEPSRTALAPEPGLAAVPNSFVMPHANRYKPGVLEAAAEAQVGSRPELIGILIEENTALVIQAGQITRIQGKGRVGIVESANSTRWLKAGDRYDLQKRVPISAARDTARAE